MMLSQLVTCEYAMTVLMIIFSCVVGIYLYLTWNYNYWKKKGVQYVNPKLVFGNIWEIFTFKKSPGELFLDIYSEGQGRDFMGIWIFRSPALVIRNPEIIKAILVKDFTNFRDRSILSDTMSDPLGSSNLFTIKEPMWKPLRIKLSPFFTSSKMKSTLDLTNQAAEDLTKYLKKSFTEDIEVKDLCGKFTTDSIASVAFGIEAGSFNDSESVFGKLGKKIFDFDTKRSLEMTSLFFAHNIAKLFKFHFFTAECTQILRKVFFDVLNEREKMKTARPDLIDILNKLKNQNIDDEGKLKFKDDTLLAQASVFFTAGFETTRSTISFTLYELTMSPHIQKIVSTEIEETLSRHNGIVTFEAIQSMKYLDMCVKETLRKYPTLPFLDRVCKNRYQIPNTDVVIEPETIVYIPMLGIHMDPQYHPEPEVYRPERFSPENLQNMNPFSYMPFGHGPRNCIGERLGMLQSKLCLIHILKDFRLTKCPRTVPKIVFRPKSFLSASLSGIYLKFEPKSKSD